jgi:hypothetical protein
VVDAAFFMFPDDRLVGMIGAPKALEAAPA